MYNRITGVRSRDSTDKLLDPREKKLDAELLKQLDINLKENILFLSSDRLLFNYDIYHSKNYKRCKQSCDYVVRFSATGKDNFGIIDQFFTYKSIIYVVLYKLRCNPYDFFKDFNIADELNDLIMI